MRAERAKSRIESETADYVYNHPVLGKYLTPKNFDVVMADETRSNLKDQYGGGGMLEAWDADDEGVEEYQHPNLGKNTIEVYDNKIKGNPEELKGYVLRDLLHFLDKYDQKWKFMKSLFKSNFSAEEKEFLKKEYMDRGVYKKQTFNEWMDRSVADGYIRGGLGEPSEYGELYESGDEKVYSPTQRKIVDKMREYLQYEGAQ